MLRFDPVIQANHGFDVVGGHGPIKVSIEWLSMSIRPSEAGPMGIFVDDGYR